MTGSATEESLRLSEERYRSLIMATAGIVWTTDAAGQVIEDQPGWRAFTGQTSEEIQGAGWLAAVDPDSRQEAVSVWARAAARGSFYQTEWRLRRRDGEYRWFSIHAAPVRSADGALREWIGCNIDITDHKQCDEELSRLQAQAGADLAQVKRFGRNMQILKNLGDTLQACNSREEAYPFIALAATELFPGACGALAVPAAGVRELLETAIEWGGDPLTQDSIVGQSTTRSAWMKADFAIEDCWGLRRGGMHEPGQGTVCHHFKTESGQAYACLPLAVRGQVSGLLSIRFTETKRLDEDGRSVLSTFGNAVALGLSTLQLRETLHENPIHGK
jgi:PAS domain S-box-containing protein